MAKPSSAPPPKEATPSRPTSSAIRIALLSDSGLYRCGLRQILERTRSVSLVGEASAPPVRDFVRACAPQILLVDAKIEDVLAVCHELRQLGARPRVILTGADEDDVWALRALKAGAHGILPKSATVENLLKAVRVIHEGEVWASKRVLTLTVEELAARCGTDGPSGLTIKTRLSRREEDIAHLIASGLRNREVGHRLGITEATVKAHLTRIFQKLMLYGRGQLAALYHQSPLPMMPTNNDSECQPNRIVEPGSQVVSDAGRRGQRRQAR
jgi:DNA-binding NarL/FixJ family response regulator